MYKYCERKHADLLLALGGIRIGTLHNFRLLEHKKGIADPMEGKKKVSHHISKLQVVDSDNPEEIFSTDRRALEFFRAIKLDSCKDITFENVQLRRSFDQANRFVLCLSKLLSKQTMAQFEDADACVQIVDINKFYQVLTAALDSITPVNFEGIHEVVYQNREEPWNGRDWGRHPSVIKEPRFAKQAEIRAIWSPKYNQPISPVIIGDWRLGRYCIEATT